MTLHVGGHRCAICGRPKPVDDRGWNSSGTWWCGACSDAYTRLRESESERDPDAPRGPGPLPAYLVAPEAWPSIGFDPADLDPFLPAGYRATAPAETTD